MTTASSDVAIIGFGFGGLMVLSNLVRAAQKPMTVTIIAEDQRGTGLAYGTTNPLHLLNVPARNMSAFAHDNAHFVHWLKTVHAEVARQELGLNDLPGPNDFSSRMLYARYLDSIRQAAIEEAQHKKITLHFIGGQVQHATPHGAGWALTVQGETYHAQRCVIATGNEVKPIFPALNHPCMIENPWQLDAAQVQSFGHRPLVMIGTGLTAVDMMLSLRRMGYAGEIHAISRNGLLPLAHRTDTGSYALDSDALLRQPNLLALLCFVRQCIHNHVRNGGDWRAVIDALRPHAITLWQHLSPRDQRSFIRRLATMWNSHRHRMAPEIAAIMSQEISTGKLKLSASHHLHPTADSGKLRLAVQWLYGGSEIIEPAAILNCSGPEQNWARSAQPLLRNLLEEGHVKAHATGMGVVADAGYRIGEALYAIGNPMNGQFWESTAVPELRVQAATIGEALCRS